MDAVTYPKPETERALNDGFVAYKPQIDKNESLARRFFVGWTPGIVILDGQENVHYRAFGWHPPEAFEHLLAIGRGNVDFHLGQFKTALEHFSTAADDTRHSPLQAEALYWQGVCRYKTGDKDGMTRSWNRLLDVFPESPWALRASFIRPRAGVAA